MIPDYRNQRKVFRGKTWELWRSFCFRNAVVRMWFSMGELSKKHCLDHSVPTSLSCTEMSGRRFIHYVSPSDAAIYQTHMELIQSSNCRDMNRRSIKWSRAKCNPTSQSARRMFITAIRHATKCEIRGLPRRDHAKAEAKHSHVATCAVQVRTTPLA